MKTDTVKLVWVGWSRILLMGMVLALSACNKKEEDAQAIAIKAQVVAAVVPVSTNVPVAWKDGLGKAYTGYLDIQQALAADDLSKAQEVISTLDAAMHGLRPEELDSTDGQDKQFWQENEKTMMDALQFMEDARTIEELREGFTGFSSAFIRVVERLGQGSGQPVYVLHCPMANANKGAHWLQSAPEIRNPYYGASMLECGEVLHEVKN